MRSGGLYVHDTTAVHTARGTFLTTAAAAAALQATVDRIDARHAPPASRSSRRRPTEACTSCPTAPRRCYELTLLPGLIATPAEQRAAIARLRREHVALAVIGARDLSVWGTPTFGVDYDKILGDYLRALDQLE